MCGYACVIPVAEEQLSKQKQAILLKTLVSFPWSNKITCPNSGIRIYTLLTMVGNYSYMAVEMDRERDELES